MLPNPHGLNLGPASDTATDFPLVDLWQFRRYAPAQSPNGKVDAFGEHLSGTNNYALSLWPGRHSYDFIIEGPMSRLGCMGIIQGGKSVSAVSIPKLDKQSVTLTVDRPTSPGEQITIIGDGPVKLSIVPTELRPLYDAGERINPRFVDQVRGFSPLRMMDPNLINSHFASEGRARLDQPHQNGMLAIEYQARICSQAGSDMWLPIRAGADGGYIRDCVQAAHDNLAPGLRINLEYSNEVWNKDGAFTQSKWLSDTAKQAYNIPALPLKAQDAALQLGLRRMYGMLSGMMANEALKIAGPDRIGVMLCWQAGSATIWDAMLEGWDTAKAPRNMLGGLAIASYPGPGLPDAAQWIGWALAGDTKSALTFMRAKLVKSAGYYPAVAAAAAKAGTKWGWGCYESNATYLRCTAPFTNDANRAAVVAFNQAFAHSEDGAGLTRDLHAALVAAGGTFDVHYNSFGKGGQYGISGMLGPSSIEGISYPAGLQMMTDNRAAWAARTRGGWLSPIRD